MLVISSLAPDIPFYLSRFPARRTHTALGVVTVDTALAAAGWVVWHGLLSRPALAAAPAAVRARLEDRVRPGLRPRLRDLRSVVRVLGGLAAGAATHVLWDEFTHAGRWGTEHLGALSAVRRGRRVHVWAQDASGVAGAGVLLAWCARWWRRTPADPECRAGGTPWAWAAVAGAGLAAGAVAALPEPHPRSAATATAFRGGAAATAASALLALGWHARRAADPAG